MASRNGVFLRLVFCQLAIESDGSQVGRIVGQVLYKGITPGMRGVKVNIVRSGVPVVPRLNHHAVFIE